MRVLRLVLGWSRNGPPNDPKNHNFEKKILKCPEVLPFHTYICTINENYTTILCTFCLLTTQKIKNLKLKKTHGDIIILHICTINDNNMMYGSWDMEYDGQDFFVILDHFLHFYPLITKKIKILKKWRKTAGCIIILLMCTINDNHMMYGSWDMECDRQNFCHCGPFFALLLPLTTRKIRILKKWKKHLEILSFYTCVPQMTIIWWMVPEIWSVADRVFCHFGLFLPFTTLKNQKKTSTWRYHHFTQVYQKS